MDGSAMLQAPSPSQEFDSAISSRLGKKQDMSAGGPQNVDLPSMAMSYAQQISMLDPSMQQMAITNIQLQSPELATLVQQYLKQLDKDRGTAAGAGPGQPPGGGQNGSPATGGVDMRPLPDQRSPRRTTAIV